MTDKYEAPFEGGKTPDPSRQAKVKNIAKNLARKAMKKAAMKEEVKPKSAQELNPGLQQRIDAASDAQKPRPLSGMRPIDKIKLMTREEVELDEEFINGREYASHGLMHPKHAMQAIHQPSDRFVDFYASGTGDKMQGKVKSNNGKEVHIQAHPKMGDGKLHTFKVTTDLPKMTNEKAELMIELSPDTLRGAANVAGSKFKMSDINPRGAHRNPKKLMRAYDRFAFLNSRAIDAGHSEKNAERNDTSYSDEYVKEIKRRKAHTANMKKIFAQRKADSAAKKAAKMKKEEFEIYEAKDEGEYDYEGDMAMSQLKSVITNAQKLHDMLEPNTNLPEWVQSKITLAEDYIVTAANYMDGEMNEEVEQIDELSKDFLTKKYGPKAMRAHLAAKAAGKRKTANKRAAGVNLAAAKAYPNQFKGTERAAKVAATNEEAEQVEEGLVGSLVKAYVRPRAQKIVGNAVGQVANTFGASSQTKRRLQRAGMKWAKNKIGEEAEQIEEKKMGYEKLASAIKSRVAKGKLAVEAHDPVGKEDADINNDGKTDKTDVYLHTKRRAIGKAIGTRLATKAGK